MTIRNLDHLFNPKSVALIGASKRPGSVGRVLARNLLSMGFDGPVMPVNPKHQSIGGVLAYPDVDSLPITPDLAVICTPPRAVPELVAKLGARGTKAAVVITAGFGEGGDQEGKELEQAMLDAARPHLLRVVGPNCLGVIVPKPQLNASFAHLHPEPGGIAFVAQSGAIVTSVVDWACNRHIGFSHLVSLGDMSDVDFGDMLDYLASDPHCTAVLMYIESIKHVRKFMSAARAAARSKPVIVVKAGRHAEGARAASSHTGAIAGVDAAYDTAFRRAGMLRVTTLEELFDAVETLAMGKKPRGDRLAILTNGGGIGVMATDTLVENGGRLADLAPQSISRLNEMLPATWSKQNPVDIIGDAPGSRYEGALSVLVEDPNVDAVVVLNCPTAVASSTEAAESVLRVVKRNGRVPVLTSWVGPEASRDARRLFSANRIPTYGTPDQAVRAFMQLVDYGRNQNALMETPPSVPEVFTPDTEAARRVLTGVLSGGREWLTEPEAKEVLAAYGLPVAVSRVAKTPREAAAFAAELGGSVVLKILSPDITHKTDVGGVLLDIVGPRAVEADAESMMARVRAQAPDAKIEGFSVQAMVQRPGAYELMIGVYDDPEFGPLVAFGQGGTGVEVVRDQAFALPPLNMHLAKAAMARTRIYALLSGYRGLAGVNLDSIALSLIKVSQLVVDFPEIAELDINPLLADEYGVMVLDARIRAVSHERDGTQRLAIRPYPKNLEEEVPLGDTRKLLLRPVVPEDEPSLQRMFSKLTQEELRLRFFIPTKTLSHMAAVRFTQLDYDREMGLVLTDHGVAGETEIYGVVSINADPDNERAEYAIVVRKDMTGLGLGILLMRRILDYAERRGIREVYGDVLRENSTMLRLCDALGFARESVVDDPALVRVSRRLSGPAEVPPDRAGQAC